MSLSVCHALCVTSTLQPILMGSTPRLVTLMPHDLFSHPRLPLTISSNLPPTEPIIPQEDCLKEDRPVPDTPGVLTLLSYCIVLLIHNECLEAWAKQDSPSEPFIKDRLVMSVISISRKAMAGPDSTASQHIPMASRYVAS